jgi:orotate phosphoribosyltransferase
VTVPPGLVDTRYAGGVAAALVESGAFTVDMNKPRDQWIRWKSGILAPCGCDCRRLNAQPACRRVVDDALAAATSASFPDADYVIGVASAGIPWAKTLAERLDLPLAYVRTEPRVSGGGLVECAPAGGARAVIVEDVVASGGSARRAIMALLAESDLKVAGIQSIANWNFPEMRTLLAGWVVRAITSYSHVLACARDGQLIDEASLGQLTAFYRDPRQYTWPGLSQE